MLNMFSSRTQQTIHVSDSQFFGEISDQMEQVMHIRKPHICTNIVVLQATNSSLTQQHRSRDHFTGCQAPNGRDTDRKLMKHCQKRDPTISLGRLVAKSVKAPRVQDCCRPQQNDWHFGFCPTEYSRFQPARFIICV